MSTGAPTILVDIGNSRMKWGDCPEGTKSPIAHIATLPHDDAAAWTRQLELWTGATGCAWVMAGVHPGYLKEFGKWISGRGESVRVIDDPSQLPLSVALDEPGKVGIDRLLNAVAANESRHGPRPVVIIDAGSAVTVDWIDADGTFRGGAIFPGLRLMAKSLHDYTALLPVVEVRSKAPILPGGSTREAIEAGVLWAVAGGVLAVVQRMIERAASPGPPTWIWTGGDSALLLRALDHAGLTREQSTHEPALTLEGLRLSVEARS